MSRPNMQRPVMDPLFLQDIQAPAGKPRFRWVPPLARALRWTAKQLLSHPISFRRSSKLTFQNEGWTGRWVRGTAYRLVFAPLVMAFVAGALVYSGTHPQAASASGDPGSFGVHYDPIDFQSDDGVRLTGWLVPVIDARRVMLHKERLLLQTYPAVVLVHDFGQGPHQMLPLIAPLHEEGIVVLAIGLRGTGLPSTVGQTFGLNESGDVLAAVNVLRRRAFVDPARIAVVGVGTGANAAVLAAEKDPSIAAVVLADPVPHSRDLVARKLGPDRTGLRWLQPVTKWCFEIAYRHDIDEINLDQHQSLLASRKHLRVDNATAEQRLMADATEKIRAFCRETLKPWGGGK